MTAASPDLSVVISSLGRARPEETIGSIVASAQAAPAAVETILAWESTQSPPELPAGTRLVETFPAGLSCARNRGLRLARAPIVAFVDDDELVDSGWVAGVLAAFGRDPSPDAVFGPVAPRDERGLAYCRFEGGEHRVFHDRTTPPWVVGTGGNMAYRREALLEAGGFDPHLGAGSVGLSAEESEMIVRLLRAGRTLAWSPEMVVYHPTKIEEERLASRYPYAYGMGKVARRHRDALLAARYLRDIGQVLTRAARTRDRRRWREGKETLRGFLAGALRRARPLAPQRALERLPDALAETLEGVPLEPQPPCYRPDPHYLYRAGPDLLLHVYANPSERLRHGLAAREQIRTETGVSGIPRLVELAEATDAFWVLEERLEGVHPRSGDPRRWFEPVAAWGVAMAGPGGRPLAETDWWRENAAGLEHECPPELRAGLVRALEVVGALPARHMHGDFQRKNVLLVANGASPARIGVVDWERAYREGLPGLDLLFLAVMARGDRPDASIVLRLAEGKEPSLPPMRSLLRRAGLEDDVLRPALLVSLAVWSQGETERLAAPGFLTRARPYREMLLHCARYLS